MVNLFTFMQSILHVNMHLPYICMATVYLSNGVDFSSETFSFRVKIRCIIHVFACLGVINRSVGEYRGFEFFVIP